MTPVVHLDNVTKRYRNVTALENVSLQIPPGVVCALLGANGAGKTTAIRVLLGLEPVDSGTASVLGIDSSTGGLEIRSRVGYVAEQPSLYDWMTVEEIGWFAAGFYPLGYAETYDRYTRRFALEPGKRVRELSKGMRAKVALSLALAHSPDLLILDEPTSGLDALVRREFLESMVDVAAEGRSVLLSSHQVSEVERVADMVAILLGGQLVCVERLDELKRTTREVVVTLPDASTALPSLPGEVLAHVPFGHEHSWMVRDLDEARLAEVCRDVGPFSVRTPGLEDILLALLREYRTPGWTHRARAATGTPSGTASATPG
ncbi:MAG: ABC transporter ATP-binding protein [Maioricimonas sp. JB049]